jgi:hypothetical protein
MMSEVVKTPEPPWSTVLVEDQALLRNVLSKTIHLDERFDWKGDAEDGLEGRNLCAKHQPHLNYQSRFSRLGLKHASWS